MFEPIVESGLITNILVHIVLIIITVFCLVLYLTRKDVTIYRYFQAFNGPPPLPIVGNALHALRPREQLLKYVIMGLVQKYGYTFAGWIGNAPYVLVASAPDVEKILSSTVITNKGSEYEKFVSKWICTGLLTARREKWVHRRKLLTPAFHFKILEDFIPIFNEQSKVLNTMLEKQIQKHGSFNISPFITKCTLDIICETAMGVRIHAQEGGEVEYVQTISDMLKLLVIKGLNPAFRIDFIWNLTTYSKLETKYLNILCKYTETMINRRKALRLQNQMSTKPSQSKANNVTTDDATSTGINSQRTSLLNYYKKEMNEMKWKYKSKSRIISGVKIRKAFLDLLLDLQECDELTDADIREEVDTFMFEGHDTTAASLEWTILMLGCHPEHQKHVHEEVDHIFGSDKERDITTADLKQLKYLECCIKEALRIFPSVPFFIRRADQDVPLDKKRIIPKGASIAISPYVLHRDPEVFPDPETFNPDRFTTDNCVGRNPYAYIPFSAGPRNCIGQKFALMEEKIVLATLFRKFRVEAVDTVDSSVPLADIILRPKNGIRVQLIERTPPHK